MEYITSLYALAFYWTFSVSLFLGINILLHNPKNNLNRYFFGMTLILCVWALGFAMSIVAKNAEAALFWRRVSAAGRTMIHAFLLHMVILLTRKEKSFSKLIQALIYVPGICSLFVFSLSSRIAPQQYHFIHTKFGWTNITSTNFFYVFFHIYYSAYMVLNFWCILNWKKNNKKSKKQAQILFFSFLGTLVLGLFSDLFFDILFKSQTPHLGPIIALPPLITIFYLTKKNNLLQKTNVADWDTIFDEASRTKLYITIAFLFISGGTVNFTQYFLPQLVHAENEMFYIIVSSFIFYLVGAFILLSLLIKKEKIRDAIVLIVTLISIPAITLMYTPTSSVTIWVIPVVFLIITLIFDSKIPITLTMLVGVITQLLVWKISPRKPLLLDEIDYFLRVAIILIAYGMGLAVNSIYIKRLKENMYQAKFQKIISEASFVFLNAPHSDYKNNIYLLLQALTNFLRVNKTYLYVFNKEKKEIEYLYQWCSNEHENEMEPDLQGISFSQFPISLDTLQQKKAIIVDSLNTISKEQRQELEILQREHFKSLLALPIEEGNKIVGFVGCDSIQKNKKWTENEIGFLKTIANMIGILLLKIKTEQEIEFLAYYDNLTGIPNRMLFQDRLKQAIELANRNEKFLGIVLIDLDSFKMINDTKGHSAGDLLLKKITYELKSKLRKIDTVARFGGDEFLILANNLKRYEDITKVMNKIMEVFKNPFEIDDQEFYITASAGVAVYPFDGDDAETLMKNADMAMYTSKDKGRNQYTLCTKEMKEETSRNLKLSNSLYGVEQRNELRLYYQPQVDITSGTIIGLEALLRWQHPEIGLVPPNLFIPLAEANGTISAIGTWVIRKALTEGKRWQNNGFKDLRIAVNLSIVQFNNPNFIKELTQIIKETDFNPLHLELEITESVAAQEEKKVIETMISLKDMGISISIDDFGTDYSSLKRLSQLPIDRIKIDKQFVQGIENSIKDSAIVNVIINLAKNLNIQVLAEGVETETQLAFLKHNNCNEVQGFLYYKPMPAEEIDLAF